MILQKNGGSGGANSRGPWQWTDLSKMRQLRTCAECTEKKNTPGHPKELRGSSQHAKKGRYRGRTAVHQHGKRQPAESGVPGRKVSAQKAKSSQCGPRKPPAEKDATSINRPGNQQQEDPATGDTRRSPPKERPAFVQTRQDSTGWAEKCGHRCLRLTGAQRHLPGPLQGIPELLSWTEVARETVAVTRPTVHAALEACLLSDRAVLWPGTTPSASVCQRDMGGEENGELLKADPQMQGHHTNTKDTAGAAAHSVPWPASMPWPTPVV